MDHDAPEVVTLDEALAVAREIGEALGGRQKRALEVLCRHAERARRPSSTAINAVEHFRNAAEIAKGKSNT